MFEKIVVPLDGSKLAEVALPYAEELGVKMGSDIVLLTINESEDSKELQNYCIYITKIKEATRGHAKKYIENESGEAIEVAIANQTGDPAKGIIDYTLTLNFPLIIMASHGRSGMSRWAVGSVADKVVRSSSLQPVMLIRAKDSRSDIRDKRLLRKALVPLDGSSESEAVIPYIEELASELKAEVTLLLVAEQPYHVYREGEGVVRVHYTEDEIKQLKASIEGYLEKLASRFYGRGIATKCEVRVGVPAEEIIMVAEEIHADLVAMSTHGWSGIGRWVFGSVAEKVLHEGNTPLLLVRALV